ncbi:ArsR/SmtB family transcription factor [Kitasatospora sp. NPDC052896]|uniref:ArsR/SmtB family transcription factor n=1 Tax=Kitasatospora sp. NPDC052896 TaxID=3364061 RepID=UPI0037CA38FA
MCATPAGPGEPDIAHAANWFADPTRSRILTALAGGRALPAGQLAAEAGVTAQAASAQLARLREAGLLAVEQSGRHRYYRLASAQVAAVIEALAGMAPLQPVRSLRQGNRSAALRAARTCYDHLAGRLGVEVTRALVDRGALITADRPDGTAHLPSDPPAHRLGPRGPQLLAALGVSDDVLTAAVRRPLLRFCLDWSEQRHHLAGRLGAELLTAMTASGWLEQSPRQRAVRVTPAGAAHLQAVLGLSTA